MRARVYTDIVEGFMQPVPTVTDVDVERIVHRDFPPDRHKDVMAILNEYGTEEWQREQARVCLAILKLAAGSMEQMRLHADMAKRDYRDVLAYAEYPEYMMRVPPSGKISEVRRREIIERDREQYEAWLTRI